MNPFKMPNKLNYHFSNLSATIQMLIGEIVLAVEGFNAEPERSSGAQWKTANERLKHSEADMEKLREFLSHCRMCPADSAIAVAACNGRSTREISEFLGMSKAYVMRRLRAITDAIISWNPDESKDKEVVHGAEVFEIFAEAQRKKGTMSRATWK